MGNKTLVLGSANVDIVIHSERMPRLGETLVGSDFQINAGGKGLNQAVAIAKLGGNVAFVGSLGLDSNGMFLQNTLREYGIRFEGTVWDGEPTGTAMITVVDGDNFILLNPGANQELTPQIVENKLQQIRESEFCVLQLEIPEESALQALKIAGENGTRTVLNPAPYKKLPDWAYPLVDYLIPNEHEAEAITGIQIQSDTSAILAVEALKKLGAKNVVITLGGKGCVYSWAGEIRFCPAEKVMAVDTTSAGDCFIGALVARLSGGDTLPEAIAFATKAAAIAVSRPGASASIPFRHEVQ